MSSAVETALAIMDQFVAPPISHDADAKADRLFFVTHFWPKEFDVAMQYIGFDLLYPGIISPIYPRNYNTRSPGDGAASVDIEIPKGGFDSRFRPGYAVDCLNEIYKKKGLVSFNAFTDAGWKYEDVKAFQLHVLPAPDDFPLWDRYRHRTAYLVDVRAKTHDPLELEGVSLMLESNQKAHAELKIVLRDTITNASKSMQSGLGRVTGTDFELTCMMLAGMRVPKFMADNSHREDLITTDEVPAVSSAPAAESEIVRESLSLMQEMAQAFTAMAATNAAASDERVAALEAKVAELTAEKEAPKPRKNA